MRLVSFTVEKYRSITNARKIGTGQLTILIGPNNEGKSNILRALVTGMQILTSGIWQRQAGRVASRLLLYDKRMFVWKRDFPLHLQTKQPSGQSVVILEFGLTTNEVDAFREEIGSNLNGTLPLRLDIGLKEAKVTVAKQGRGAKTLTAKSGQIARFVASRLDFEHIPAVRTATSAKAVVEKLVERELRILEDEPEYIEALKKIGELQQPILTQLSQSIRQTLVGFLPDVKDVRIEIDREERYRAFRRSCAVTVDDGAATLLEYKGDGVQSLAALGIMRHASERSEATRNLVIAIEEPESHLHPRAIHELRQVLEQLAQKHQVVVTTHCPLFVNRARLRSNIVVNNNRAHPAKSVNEVREILGVRASDNLRHADLVLLVEGEEDKIVMDAILRDCSSILRTALDSGLIVVDCLGGASNLSYKASLIRDALCSVHCFLDGDIAGLKAFAAAKEQGVLSDAEAHLALCDGKKEAEIEDLFLPDIYASMLKNRYGVNLSTASFRNSKKWSTRMRDTFTKQGKPWNENVEMEVKRQVARLVAGSASKALIPAHRSVIDSLTEALEMRLSQIPQA